MDLKCPRFSVDPKLKDCLNGTHRMLAPEDGLSVKRVQAALIALGQSVGPKGDDGFFGPDTGTAVSAYKVNKGLTPSDPVVGSGTMAALDADLFFNPPSLDPAFKEFAPSVTDHRIEPFVGLELAALIDTPLNSWRRMIAFFTLNNLNSGTLLGIAAQGQAGKLRDQFLVLAAPTQGGTTAENFFDTDVKRVGPAGVTSVFAAKDGTQKTYVLIKDRVILERDTTLRVSTGTRAPVTTQGTLVHELTHVRNRAASEVLFQTPDSDTASFVDTALAQASTAGGVPTALVLQDFVEEICARHVEWIVVKETAGNPTAPRFLAPEALAEAARFYAAETRLFDVGGYLPGIKAQGRPALFSQLALWLRHCQSFAFSDDPAEDARTNTLFGAAADVCAQVAAGAPLTAQADGLFPLAADFV